MKYVKLFLSQNPDYISDTVHIKGVKTPSGEKRDVFAVFVGIGRLLQNYTAGGRPNAEITFDPAKGFNYGALTLCAKSKNASGISRLREIVIDKTVTHTNKVSGPMDAWFAKWEEKGEEKKETEEPDCATPRPKAAAAAPEPVATPTKEPAKAGAPAKAASAEPPKEWRVECPDLGLTLSLSDTGKVMVLSSNSSNKKIPKNLFLAEWMDGEVPRRYDRVVACGSRRA